MAIKSDASGHTIEIAVFDSGRMRALVRISCLTLPWHFSEGNLQCDNGNDYWRQEPPTFAVMAAKLNGVMTK